jgi:hypothetical protein
MRRCVFLLTALLFLCTAPHGYGLITAKLPLRQVLNDATYICTVKVETIDADKLGAILVVDDDLKGKFPVRRFAVNLTGDAEAKKYDHTKQLLKRLAPRMTIVLFVNVSKERDKVNYGVFSYSNGTWFQLLATKAPEGEKTVFRFLHCEPYLRRTYKGTTEEMKTLVNDVLAGIATPPEFNDKEAPGLGPQVMEEKKDGGQNASLDCVDSWLLSGARFERRGAAAP